MSTDMTKFRAFILTSAMNGIEHSRLVERFTSLIQTYGVDIEVGTTLPNKASFIPNQLLIIDLFDYQVGNGLPKNIAMLASQNTTILFNATPDVTCERTALLSHVKGIFYYDDRPDIILKGFNTILNGEFWFKRSTINLAIAELLAAGKAAPHPDTIEYNDIIFPTLTKRERTIIHLVSRGAQNKEIADQLHISPNTVKTHIYSIFRKTSSRNRIELITWSQRYQTAHALNS